MMKTTDVFVLRTKLPPPSVTFVVASQNQLAHSHQLFPPTQSAHKKRMNLPKALFYVSLMSGTTSAYLAAASRSRPFSTFLSRRTSTTPISSTPSIVTPSHATTTQLQMSTQPTAAEALIQKEIESNKVTVFSKSYCPYCTATKSLFKDLVGNDFKVIELDQRSDGDAIQSALLQLTGQRTVPNTFINGQHLGGNDKAQAAAKSGELKKKLGI